MGVLCGRDGCGVLGIMIVLSCVMTVLTLCNAAANVSSINRSLSVDLVDADNGNSISAQVSFLVSSYNRGCVVLMCLICLRLWSPVVLTSL